MQTDRTFTGQKEDATGLLYFNARYYDPQLGTFLSPDTIVPDAGVVIDYNRYLYARGNPVKYADPSGHCVFGIDTFVCVVAGAAFVGGAANAAGDIGVQVANHWNDHRTLAENLTDFNRKEAAIAFGYGTIGGATAPVTGPGGAMAINAFLGAAQEVTTDMAVEGKSFTESIDGETALAAGFGVVGAKIQGAIPDELVYSLSDGVELGVATGKEALAYGGSWFAKHSNRQLFSRQMDNVFRARFISGAGIGNVTNLADKIKNLWQKLRIPNTNRKQ